MTDLIKIMHCGCQYNVNGQGGGSSITEEIFGTGADGNCVIEYNENTAGNVFLPVGDYNFNNLTICSGVKLRFCGEGVPILRVKGEFVNDGELWLRNPFICCNNTSYIPTLGRTITTTKNDDYDTAVACYNMIFARVGDPSQGKGGSGGYVYSGTSTCDNCYYNGKGGKGGDACQRGCNGCTPTKCKTGTVPGGCGGSGGTLYAGGGGGGGGGSYCLCCDLTQGASGTAGNNGCGGKGGKGATAFRYSNGSYASYPGTGGGGGYGYCKGGDGGAGGQWGLSGTNLSCTLLAGGSGGDSYLGKGGNGGTGYNYQNCCCASSCVCFKGGNGGWSMYGDGGDGGWSGGIGGSSIFGNAGKTGCMGIGIGCNAGQSIYGNGADALGCCASGGNGLNGGRAGSCYSTCRPSGGIAYGGAYGIGIFAKTFCLHGSIEGNGGNAGVVSTCYGEDKAHSGTHGANIYIVTGQCYVCTGVICNCGGTRSNCYCSNGKPGVLYIKNTNY